MNGQMKNYKSSLASTQYKDYSQLLGINIDYKGLIKYAGKKGVAPVDLSDEEKNMFIKNSDMKTINKLREEIEA